MRGNRRIGFLRTLLIALAIETVLMSTTAVTLAIMSFAVRDDRKSLEGLGDLLLIASVLCAGVAVVCGMGVAGVRDAMRRGTGALARAAAVGLIHLFVALVAALMNCPTWSILVAGLPAVIYLPCWWAVRERSHHELLMLEP
ncbi:hypothetical protein [Embleya scabrispora]|uniref:hypothetical protein n=1 Tax=Embleya scabrispora TaxID=159449 RepID=UPI00035D07DC|nr:hypothetical protein [Embleya scabrispora]MYS81919.1 hypothetical protein [Streptomyces sp. SID5474]